MSEQPDPLVQTVATLVEGEVQPEQESEDGIEYGSEAGHPGLSCHPAEWAGLETVCAGEQRLVFGPLPDPSSAALPSDVKSQVFMDVVRSLKSSFESREDFSAFLCTQIAARGAVPNATLVLGIGGWGSKGDVGH